jgi:hypothetical protein
VVHWPPLFPNPARIPSLLERLQATLGTSYSIERELGGGGMSKVFGTPGAVQPDRLNAMTTIPAATRDVKSYEWSDAS